MEKDVCTETEVKCYLFMTMSDKTAVKRAQRENLSDIIMF